MAIRLLLFPLFILRLKIALLPFVFQVILQVIKPYVSVVFFLVLIGLYITSFFKSLEKNVVIDSSLPTQVEISQTEKKTNELQQKFSDQQHLVLYQDDKKLTLISQQLTKAHQQNQYHRDILLNLAVINAAQGNIEIAQSFLQDVEYSDPNNTLFSN